MEKPVLETEWILCFTVFQRFYGPSAIDTESFFAYSSMLKPRARWTDNEEPSVVRCCPIQTIIDEYQFAQDGRRAADRSSSSAIWTRSKNSGTLDEKMSVLFLHLLFHVESPADRLCRDFADTLYITESRIEGKLLWNCFLWVVHTFHSQTFNDIYADKEDPSKGDS